MYLLPVFLFIWQCIEGASLRCKIEKPCFCLTDTSLASTLRESMVYINFVNSTNLLLSKTLFGTVDLIDNDSKPLAGICIFGRRRRILECKLELMNGFNQAENRGNQSASSCNCSCKLRWKRTVVGSQDNSSKTAIRGIMALKELVPNELLLDIISQPSKNEVLLTVQPVGDLHDPNSTNTWYVRCVKLSNDSQNCSKDEEKNELYWTRTVQIRNNESSSYEIRNLLPGHYCILVCLANNCNRVRVYKSFSIDNSNGTTNEPLKDNSIWIAIALVVGIIVIAISLVAMYYRNCKKARTLSLRREKFDWSTVKSKTVFVAYDRESADFIALVCSFADVLECYFHCEVIIDERYLSEVLENVAAWIEKQLKLVDLIVIINSRGTRCSENNILNKQPFVPTETAINPVNIFYLFLSYMLMTKDFSNNKRIFNIRFNQTDDCLRSLTSDTIYEIPRDLRNLFLDMHAINCDQISPSEWPVWQISDLLKKLPGGKRNALGSNDNSIRYTRGPSDNDGSFNMSRNNGSLTLLLNSDNSNARDIVL